MVTHNIRATMTFVTLLNLFLYARVQCDAVVEQQEDTCTGDTCQNEDILKQEKLKYHLEKAKEYHAARTKQDHLTEELTEEELKDILNRFRDKSIDIDDINSEIYDGNSDIDDINRDIDDRNSEIHKEKDNVYEFPNLTQIEPTYVGDEIELELEEGQIYTMITRSLRPPVFEIPDFLSEEECTHIIDKAKGNGLEMSNLFGSDVEEEFENLDLSEISRVSEQTWLSENDIGSEFLGKLQRRLAKLTGLPLGLIQRGEPIQVVKYAPGGHYHAHLDTTEYADHLPCCFQTNCGDKEFKPEWAECCRLCRFATVLYYLNEPDVGGETAFPLADMSEELVEEKFTNLEEQEWYNLSHYCYNASLAVQPRQGTAILWYSHFVDEQTGYLGKVDRRSNHGGCDLIQGKKWIANNWISGTTFKERFKPSIFYIDGS